MAGEIGAGTRHAPVEANRGLIGQEQREDAPAKANTRFHPFNWWDFLLLIVPVAIVVLAIS